MNLDIDKELYHVIIQTLHSCLSPDKAIIDQAQSQLFVLQIREEYCLILLNLILDQTTDFGIRQLAGVMFKQYIEIHWNQNSEKFKEPEMNDRIKARIKQVLPTGLADQSSKIRSMVAYSVATIAHWDWPEQWPDLFGILLSSLSAENIDINAVHGTLETLTEIVQEVTDLQLPQIAPAIIPQLYKIFIDPNRYPINLRTNSIDIFTSLVNVISEMAEYDSAIGKKYLFPYLNDFIVSMLKVMSLSNAESPNLVDYNLKKEILKSITTVLKSFPKKLTNYMNDILSQVWNCLVQSSDVYVKTVVNSEQYESSDEKLISEDDKRNFENLVYQLFDFILILKEKSRYKMTIKKAIDELSYYAISYMQITDEKVETWTENPEQFVQDEDEEGYSYSVRISGQELIETLASDFKTETGNAILKSIQRHMQYAQKLKETGDISWWKLSESCLLALSSVKPVLSELSEGNQLETNLTEFINQFVIACLHESNFPFLVGRALFTASRFPKLIYKDTLETLLKVTANALIDNQNPIIRVSAMKSIYCFCEELSNDNQENIIIPHLPQIFDGLINMISQNSTNQIGYLSMETLLNALSINEEYVGTIESKICPFVIALFIKNTTDPLVNSLISDIIKNLLTNQFTNEKMEQRLLPTLVSILNTTVTSKQANAEPKDFSAILTSTLDLISVLLRNTKQTQLPDLMSTAFFHIINLCIKADDTAILQSGSECLRAFVFKSVDQIVLWKDEKGASALNYIVMVINHMLDPKTSENGCSSVGKLINTLIRKTAHVLGEHLDFILKAILSKMHNSNLLSVQQSLIMVFAHLMHSKMNEVLTFLSNLPGPTGKPSLEFLMTEWVSKQTLFSGAYDCKISILSLAKILEHSISTDDQRFQNVFVKGDRIINPVEGIRTRSKVKNEQELYTQVPLLVKIYKLLINELHGLLEEKKDEEDYEDEDEEGEEEDEENSDEDKSEMDGMDENAAQNDNINNYLSKYDIFDDAFEKEDVEDDPEAEEDPLMKIDLLEYLKQYLTNLSKQPFYSVFVQHHNQSEKEVLQEIGITNV